MVDFLHVVAIFQHIDQTHQFGAVSASISALVDGIMETSACLLSDLPLPERRALYPFLPISVDVNRAVIIGHNVFSTCFRAASMMVSSSPFSKEITPFL